VSDAEGVAEFEVAEFEVFTWAAMYGSLCGNMTASEPLHPRAVCHPLVAIRNAINETMQDAESEFKLKNVCNALSCAMRLTSGIRASEYLIRMGGDMKVRVHR
jgi:hypothetical protein